MTVTISPGTGYDDDTKARVLAVYAEQQSARKTALLTGVHYQTIHRWAEDARQQHTAQHWRCCNRLNMATDPCGTCHAPPPPRI
jgi:transposase-like protein